METFKTFVAGFLLFICVWAFCVLMFSLEKVIYHTVPVPSSQPREVLVPEYENEGVKHDTP